MATTTQTSESLIGSLCREMAHLRQSWRLLNGHLNTCCDTRLRLRLSQEATRLQCRRQEIQRLAGTLAGLPLHDPLGAAFLVEIAGRPFPI